MLFHIVFYFLLYLSFYVWVDIFPNLLIIDLYRFVLGVLGVFCVFGIFVFGAFGVFGVFVVRALANQ